MAVFKSVDFTDQHPKAHVVGRLTDITVVLGYSCCSRLAWRLVGLPPKSIDLVATKRVGNTTFRETYAKAYA